VIVLLRVQKKPQAFDAHGLFDLGSRSGLPRRITYRSGTGTKPEGLVVVIGNVGEGTILGFHFFVKSFSELQMLFALYFILFHCQERKMCKVLPLKGCRYSVE
jgi:tricorn protease-like protein